MNPRRGDGLAILLRLKRHEMENVGVKMAEANRAIDRIECERQSLLEQLEERGDPDAIESTRVLSDFIRNVSETIHSKEAEANQLRQDSASVLEKLNALYADAKRIELIRQRRSDTRKRLINNAEIAAQNEGFLSIWLERN